MRRKGPDKSFRAEGSGQGRRTGKRGLRADRRTSERVQGGRHADKQMGASTLGGRANEGGQWADSERTGGHADGGRPARGQADRGADG